MRLSSAILLASLLVVNSSSSWELGPFEREDGHNPVLGPLESTAFYCPIQQQKVQWEAKDVFNPSAVVKDGKVHLHYRAEDHVGRLAGTSRIGLAVSSDGHTFTRAERRTEPVLFPAQDAFQKFEWPGGIEDPRVVRDEEGQRWVMTYTSYDGTARLCAATSTDLISWEKHGPVFAGTAFADAWSKSGAVVVKLVERRGEEDPGAVEMVAARLPDGLYRMYWGEVISSTTALRDIGIFAFAAPNNINMRIRERNNSFNVSMATKRTTSTARPPRTWCVCFFSFSSNSRAKSGILIGII